MKNLNAQNQSVISSYAYENDILGRRTSIAQRGSDFDLLQLHGQSGIQVAYNDRSEVTGYDITKLLDGAKQSGGVLPAAGQPRPDAQPKPAPQFAQTYANDSIGNRTQFITETGGEKTDVLYETNALNQYTKLKRNEEDPENPTHDPDGNLLDDRRNHYTWNAENRLVKVEAKDGSYTVENAYDYQGRKTTRRHLTSSSVKTTIYLYDGWNLLAEIEDHQDLKDGKNQSEASTLKPAASSLKPTHSFRTYTWGRDLSGTLQGVGGVGGQLAIAKKVQNLEDSVMFPCYDANGNIGQMISPKAEILAAYQFDAFGRTVDLAGEKAAENEWRFSTKPLAASTGFYYYIFREFDPEAGRWNSRDPIWERGGVNLYGFVGNESVSKTDHLGLKIKVWLCTRPLNAPFGARHVQIPGPGTWDLYHTFLSSVDLDGTKINVGDPAPTDPSNTFSFDNRKDANGNPISPIGREGFPNNFSYTISCRRAHRIIHKMPCCTMKNAEVESCLLKQITNPTGCSSDPYGLFFNNCHKNAADVLESCCAQ